MLNSSLHQQVRRTIRRYSLCPPGTRLLVGVSGGSDSVALTLLMLDLAEYGGFGLVSLAHFNHRLRSLAGRDEQFCRDLASRLGLAIEVDSADVKAYAASERLSLEDAARRLRYEFLDRAATRCGADRIGVGHTEDDQAETYLIKLIRGAGLTGLGGVYPRRGRVIRPLLDTSRADLRDYLASRGEAWVEDETNAEPGTLRNRIRHQVLPALDSAAGGATRPAIARAAALAREDGQWLDDSGSKRFADLATMVGNAVHIHAAGLAAEPFPVQRRVLLLAMRARAGDREVGLDHVQSVLEVLAGMTAGVDIPGSHVELQGRKLVLGPQEARAK